MTYSINNWDQKDQDNLLFQALRQANIATWLTGEGDFAYRMGNDGQIKIVSASKFKLLMKNKLGFAITIDEYDSKTPSRNLDTSMLLIVDAEDFNPFVHQEFYSNENKEVVRNTFRPTKYMLDDGIGDLSKFIIPTVIIALIMNLLDNNQQRFNWFINWLAAHMQTLKRPIVACVLKGRPGSGKGLFVTEVLARLFGEQQVININDQGIRKNFTAAMFTGKLVFNLDEISHSVKDNHIIKNFLKQLVTNPVVQMENKFKDLNHGIKVYGLTLITTNVPQALSIEHFDRRYSVYNTGKHLKHSNYLGLGNYQNLSKAIESELEDFAKYLKSIEVDFQMANTAEETPEKDALVDTTNNWYLNFHNALTDMNLHYFEVMKEDSSNNYLYKDLLDDFTNFRLKKSNLKSYFSAVEEQTISTRQLLKQLKIIDAVMYSPENTLGSHTGERYFLLEGHPKFNQGAAQNDDSVAETNSELDTAIVMPQYMQVGDSLIEKPQLLEI